VQQRDTPVMLAVGTVPAAVACDTAKTLTVGGVTYFAVPSASLTPFGNVRPILLWAKCG
jgi:hypothetical protein